MFQRRSASRFCVAFIKTLRAKMVTHCAIKLNLKNKKKNNFQRDPIVLIDLISTVLLFGPLQWLNLQTIPMIFSTISTEKLHFKTKQNCSNKRAFSKRWRKRDWENKQTNIMQTFLFPAAVVSSVFHLLDVVFVLYEVFVSCTVLPLLW